MKEEEVNQERTEKLTAKLKVQREEENRNRMKKQQFEEDKWFRTVYFDLSTEDRRAVKDSVFRNKFRLPRGIVTKLRTVTGVNFSKPPPLPRDNLSDTAVRIKDYADRNSSDNPAERAHQATSSKTNKPDERFTIHYLSVLHDDYNSENPGNEVSYRTFCRHWPTYIKKPRLSDRTSCHFRCCENSAMIVSALDQLCSASA